MTYYRVLLIICIKISPILAMFEEKPDFSTSDLHELHDRKLRNQFMMEQNRECQSYFWDVFTKENYFVWVRKVFHKSRIPKLNQVMLQMRMIKTVTNKFRLQFTSITSILKIAEYLSLNSDTKIKQPHDLI